VEGIRMFVYVACFHGAYIPNSTFIHFLVVPVSIIPTASLVTPIAINSKVLSKVLKPYIFVQNNNVHVLSIE
jgi:hypothetical protein